MRTPGPEQGLLFAYAVSEGAAVEVEAPAPQPKQQRRRKPPVATQVEMRTSRGRRVLIDLPDGTTAYETLPPLPAKLSDCQQAPVWNEETKQWEGGICPKLTCKAHVLLTIAREGESEVISIGARSGMGDGVSLAGKQTESRVSGGKLSRAALDRKTTEIANRVVEASDALPSTCLWDYVANPDIVPCDLDPYDDLHMTLQQIGTVFSVTREAIRLTERRALDRATQAEGFAEWAEAIRDVLTMRSQRQRTEPPAFGFVPASSLTKRLKP